MNITGNTRGALFMVAAMAGFTVNDAMVKAVTVEMNTAQIMFVRGAMTSLLVLMIARAMARKRDTAGNAGQCRKMGRLPAK